MGHEAGRVDVRGGVAGRSRGTRRVVFVGGLFWRRVLPGLFRWLACNCQALYRLETASCLCSCFCPVLGSLGGYTVFAIETCQLLAKRPAGCLVYGYLEILSLRSARFLSSRRHQFSG